MNPASALCLGALVIGVLTATDWALVRLEFAKLDDADRATEMDERVADLMQRQHPRPARPALSIFCRVCGDEIPLRRRVLVAGVRTCVDCQAELEAGA